MCDFDELEIENSDRNWTDDYYFENGNYMNTCIICKKHFFGYKRRVMCKICDNVEPIKLPVGTWEEYSKFKPPGYGKYLVCREDGKIHFEKWNGTGFAYNNKVIVYWASINKPVN